MEDEGGRGEGGSEEMERMRGGGDRKGNGRGNWEEVWMGNRR